MEVTIIDNTPERSAKLKAFLETKEISLVQSFEVNDDLAGNNSKLFLIHKSNDNIASFVKKIEAEKFILFFSGAGITNNIERINYTNGKFNLPDVFNVGNEEQALNRIGQIVDILKKENNATNAISEIEKVLGFDEGLEKLLQLFATTNPFKSENTKGDNLKKAKEALNTYIKSKS